MSGNMAMAERERVYRCRVAPCQRVKGDSNRWFVAIVDKNQRLVIDRFTKRSADIHGAREICSEACMHTHLSRWTAGEITAVHMPEGAPPAELSDGLLTAWVSDVYETRIDRRNGPPSPARIINYRDRGERRSIWCFKESAFNQVDLTAGRYATFRLVKKGTYWNVVEVLQVDGEPVELFSKGDHVG